jgi:hypothetical protein
MLFGDTGYIKFNYDEQIVKWAECAKEKGSKILANPDQLREWLQCEGTWFVGVDVLPNDTGGGFYKVKLPNVFSNFMDKINVKPYHKAQLSVIYPGYPRPRRGDSKSAFEYRLKRDAAHVDGLLPVGAQKRRYLIEPHGVILGVPLNNTHRGASPVVVWKGSHRIMRQEFSKILSNVPPSDWKNIDLTEAYKNARRQCFESCERTLINSPVGTGYALHPLLLHGITPWFSAKQGTESLNRQVAYFRPLLNNVQDWLKIC